ncbi:hypothetical protein [Micrococcus sp. UYEF12]|uniref:hypothetical protein n=1 Tax=Micrococcus sp. UYEF12 TaxID=1756388 RepID=UPI003398E0E6
MGTERTKLSDLWSNLIAAAALVVSAGTLVWTSSKRHPSNQNASRAAEAAEAAIFQAKQSNIIAQSAATSSEVANGLSEEANRTANDALTLAKSDSERNYYQTVAPWASNAASALHDYWAIFLRKPPINGFDPPYKEAITNIMYMRSIVPNDSPAEIFLGAVQDALNAATLTRLVSFGLNRAIIEKSGDENLNRLHQAGEEAAQLPLFAMIHINRIAFNDPHSDIFLEPAKVLSEGTEKIHEKNRPLWEIIDADYPGNLI